MTYPKPPAIDPQREAVIYADLRLTPRRYYHALYLPGHTEATVHFTIGALLEHARQAGIKEIRIFTSTYPATLILDD